MKKLFLTALIFTGLAYSATSGYVIFDHYDGRNKDLESVVQDGLYKLGGKAYQNEVSSEERNQATQETLQRILRNCPRSSGVFTLPCVTEQIQFTLKNLAVERVRKLCQANMDYAQEQKTVNQFRTDLNNRVSQNRNSQNKFGLCDGFFNQYLDTNNVIYAVERSNSKVQEQERQEQEKRDERTKSSRNIVIDFLDWLFSSEPAPTVHPQQPVQPSAPPETLVRQQSEEHPVYQTEECQGCFQHFDSTTRPVVLPCGHAHYCYECMVQWLKNSPTCPDCRQTTTLNDINFL